MGKVAEVVSWKMLVQAILAVFALGGVAATFYRSQGAQDGDRAFLKERIKATETRIEVVEDNNRGTKIEIEKQREELTRTRIQIAEIATEQRRMSEVQGKMDSKLDDVREILLEVKAKSR